MNEQRIHRLAEEVCALQTQAAEIYAREVEAIIRRNCRDSHRIEQALDGLLGVACHVRCLELFRTLCRHYFLINPAATASYIHAYRELWDADDAASAEASASDPALGEEQADA